MDTGCLLKRVTVNIFNDVIIVNVLLMHFVGRFYTKMNINELLEQLSQNNIVIYGTGHVGMIFFRVLKEHGLKNNIACFAVSTHINNKNEIEGIPVLTVEEIVNLNKVIVCIAVHESLRDEIIHILIQREIRKYIWIYPFMHELLMGSPIETGIYVDLDRIMRNYKKEYALAVRYMALEQYFGKSEIGYDIYIRANSLHCERKTAEKRLENFCKLICNWTEHGVDKNSRILINTQYQIIDGFHRIVIARYFKQRELKCNIYADTISLDDLHGEKAVLTQEILRDSGFSYEEIRIIDEKNKFIIGG
ncbi:MAG: hypothetical protein NC433_04975 [Clostridiales bacterium]|nr:hypothetical protein [Clostridiales bacterium]